MRFDLPAPVLDALRRLNARGYEAYAVGGCVRDLARGETPHDYDLCVSCTPQQTHACFAGERVIDTGVRHGTVTVLLGGMPLEITTYRADGAYTDGRHPDSVRFTRSLEEDLRRRDFTVNAMAYHPDAGLVDLFGGQRDLAARVIRCVGDPEARFTEDALRILRALRFAARLRFTVERQTADALRALRGRLCLVSRERVAAELLSLLTAPGGAETLLSFDCVLSSALPALSDSARNAGLSALGRLTAPDAALALAALLHACREAEARACLSSLRLPKSLENDVSALCSLAVSPFPAGDAALFLARLGETQLRRLLALQTACGALSPEDADMRARRAQAALDARLPLTLRDLPLRGEDLTALGLRGPAIGQALAAAHRKTLRGEIPCERGALLRFAADWAQNLSAEETESCKPRKP